MAGRDGAASASMRSTLLRDLLTFTIYLYVSHMRYVVSALGNINVTGLATSVSMSDSIRVGQGEDCTRRRRLTTDDERNELRSGKLLSAHSVVRETSLTSMTMSPCGRDNTTVHWHWMLPHRETFHFSVLPTTHVPRGDVAHVPRPTPTSSLLCLHLSLS